MHVIDSEALKLLRDPLRYFLQMSATPALLEFLCEILYFLHIKPTDNVPISLIKNQAISQICTYNATLHLSNTYVAQTGNQDIFTLPLSQKHFKHLKTDKHNM